VATILGGNCSASPPSGSGSRFPPSPSIFQVVPASAWSGGDLRYIYPASSGAGEFSAAWNQLAAGAIPVYGIYEFFGSLFGNASNAPDAVNYFAFSLQPKSFGKTGEPAQILT
jgi:hypothetical protein